MDFLWCLDSSLAVLRVYRFQRKHCNLPLCGEKKDDVSLTYQNTMEFGKYPSHVSMLQNFKYALTLTESPNVCNNALQIRDINSNIKQFAFTSALTIPILVLVIQKSPESEFAAACLILKWQV